MMNNLTRVANAFLGIDPETERPEDDIFVRVLATIITDDQAAVALMLSMELQTAEEIAAHAGVEPESIRRALGALEYAGVINSYSEDGVMVKYSRALLAPGFVEHYLLRSNNQDREHADLWREWCESLGAGTIAMVPIGGGGMRVVPINKAIRADMRTVSYEEIETYLDGTDIFSSSDCVCRLSAKLQGNGCEHPIEGMCIQIGPEAEYYIRTGLGSKVSRAEVEKLLKKAEDNGLCHEVFNGQGTNNSLFICNCCLCSCVNLIQATLFQVPDAVRSNFAAEVDSEKCVGCGACVENCVDHALTLGSAFCKESQVPEYDKAFDTEWGEENWDRNYRERRMVNSFGTAPCKTQCPAHISIQGYIRKAQEGKFDEALKVIKRDNPFPAICGRICPRSCENECTRQILDEALAIDDIKKYIADKELESKNRFVPDIIEKRNGKIAVIGSGPAGLSCAYYAAVEGFDVTVFEKEKKLGGMMTLGIPSFRLGKEVIEAEIDVLRQLGVKFVTGVEIGKNETIAGLRKEGFGAFFIGIGAQGARKLGVEGEGAAGVINGVDFMRSVNLDTAPQLKGKTVVIGGGNVAIDVARTSVRMGSSSTELYCLESKEEMPALEEEQTEAALEGIGIHNSWGPKRIMVKDGKAIGVEFKKCISVFDTEGRFNPQYDDKNTIIVECENVLVSIGQFIEWGAMLEGTGIKTSRGNMVVADLVTLQTAAPDIFAGGDVLTGPKFAIDAIAAGKSGATSIKRYLLGQNLSICREREFHALDKENIDLSGFDRLQRQRIPEVDYSKSRKTFKDLRTNLTDEQIKNESCRCLGCGISVVDEYRCVGCGICTTKCEFDAIKLVRRYSIAPPRDSAAWSKNLEFNALARAERIANKAAAVR